VLVYASQTVNESSKVLKIAQSFVGVKEQNNNSGYWVNKFLKNVHLSSGNQWCGAFVSYCLDSAKVTSLKVRSGLARRFVTKKSIKATQVLYGNKQIPSGSIIIWKRGGSIFGHVGIVEQWKGLKGYTIEGNTTSGIKGVQFTGDGVYRRIRSIYPLNYFRITDFTIYGKN
jgi:hypothetical protein